MVSVFIHCCCGAPEATVSLLPHPAFFRATVEKCGTVLVPDSICPKHWICQLTNSAEFIRRISSQLPSTLASFGKTWGKFQDYCPRNFYRGEKAVCHMAARELIMKKRCIYFFLLKSIYNVLIQSWWWILFSVWHTVYPFIFMLLPTTCPFLFQNRPWKYIFLMRSRRHDHLTVCFYTSTDAAAWEASYRCWSSSRESISAGIKGINMSTSCVHVVL